MAPLRASTAVFALAASAAFGLAVRDSLRGTGSGAPRAVSAEAAADAATAAELAAAEAAFERAAAARAGESAAVERAMRSLLAALDAVGRPEAELRAQLAAQPTVKLAGAPYEIRLRGEPGGPYARLIEWGDAALEGSRGEVRLTAVVRGGRVAELEAAAALEPARARAAIAQLAERFGAPADDHGILSWRRGAARIELAYLGGRLSLRTGAPRSE